MNKPIPEISIGNNVHLWRKLPWLVLGLGLGLSVLLYQLNLASQREREQNYFDYRVREAIDLIEDRMATYQQVLRGVRGLFETQQGVSREEFRHFIEHQELTENYPGIQGVGFAQLVRPGEKTAHTSAVRREGFPSYEIKPAGERAFYTSIVYLEPFWGRNLRAFGYDMYSEPVRREAMQRAVDTGAMALSGKVRLQQESGSQEQAGFLIYQAVYGKNRHAQNAQEQRALVSGWVYAPFRMSDFLSGLMGERAADLMVSLYDGLEATPESQMHNEEPDQKDGYRYFETTRQIHLMGHVWTAHFHSTPSMLLRLDNRLPMMVGIGSAILSVLLSLLVWMLVTGRERALLTARKMNEALTLERARLSAILEGTHVGTWEWNIQTGETTFNEEWAAIIGYELEELAPISIDTWMRLTHPDDLTQSEQLLQKHFSGEHPFYECEARMKHKLGHWVWVLDRGKVTSRSADGKPLMMYGTHQDITLRKEQENHLRHGAEHDILTGLPNRVLLADRLERALLAAERDHSPLALMFMDIDGFKQVNDNYGHEAGDVVLRTMARRIQAAMRASDTLARVGGDEFVVLLPDIGETQNAQVLAHTIAAEARRAIRLNAETSAHLSLSIGIALYPVHGTTAALLTERADQAMYKAKKGGKDAVVLFEAGWADGETVPSLLNDTAEQG